MIRLGIQFIKNLFSGTTFSDNLGGMNKDLVEIYNAITDLKIQLPTEFTQAELDFPEIVVVGGQV